MGEGEKLIAQPAIQDLTEEKSTTLNTCIICLMPCTKIDQDKHYCCLDVPAEHIDKPIRQWMCQICALRISAITTMNKRNDIDG